jgi:hypothetical protein
MSGHPRSGCRGRLLRAAVPARFRRHPAGAVDRGEARHPAPRVAGRRSVGHRLRAQPRSELRRRGYEPRAVASRNPVKLATCGSSAAFVVAAATVGTANLVAPFERGWWLTAYLFLVGGLAQLLLIRGQDTLTAGSRQPPASLAWAQWALWNAGTASVAVADMAHVMAGVDAGSVALLLALVLYRIGSRRPERTSSRHASALQRGYAALLVVLGGSVLLGTFLAGALPGQ